MVLNFCYDKTQMIRKSYSRKSHLLIINIKIYIYIYIYHFKLNYIKYINILVLKFTLNNFFFDKSFEQTQTTYFFIKM